MEGVKDKSKLLLLEDAASKERKLEEIRKHDEVSKASKAVAVVREEVDKLSERVSLCFPIIVHYWNIITGSREWRITVFNLQVSALEVAVDGGTKVSDKEFVVSTELLMRQLLKLDGIEAEGEAKLQRKAEVVFMVLELLTWNFNYLSINCCVYFPIPKFLVLVSHGQWLLFLSVLLYKF